MYSLKFLRLLDDLRVVEEIERYKWLESEKAGEDIGREKAAWEWIIKYGHSWLKIHKPIEYENLMTEHNNRNLKLQLENNQRKEEYDLEKDAVLKPVWKTCPT